MYISAKCRNRDNSGIVLRKVGIPTLSTDSGIAPDSSRMRKGYKSCYSMNCVNSASTRQRKPYVRSASGLIFSLFRLAKSFVHGLDMYE